MELIALPHEAPMCGLFEGGLRRGACKVGCAPPGPPLTRLRAQSRPVEAASSAPCRLRQLRVHDHLTHLAELLGQELLLRRGLDAPRVHALE